MKITTIWPDGSLVRASGWHDLEEQIRFRQWHKYSTGQFRREMRRRAEILAGFRVRVSSAEILFRDLEQAGMVRIEVSEEEGDDDGGSPG